MQESSKEKRRHSKALRNVGGKKMALEAKHEENQNRRWKLKVGKTKKEKQASEPSGTQMARRTKLCQSGVTYLE